MPSPAISLLRDHADTQPIHDMTYTQSRLNLAETTRPARTMQWKRRLRPIALVLRPTGAMLAVSQQQHEGAEERVLVQFVGHRAEFGGGFGANATGSGMSRGILERAGKAACLGQLSIHISRRSHRNSTPAAAAVPRGLSCHEHDELQSRVGAHQSSGLQPPAHSTDRRIGRPPKRVPCAGRPDRSKAAPAKTHGTLSSVQRTAQVPPPPGRV